MPFLFSGWKTSPEKPALLLSGLAALLWRLWLAWHPIPWLIEHAVTDDMFYYLTLATHWVAGQGVSFDGLLQTNGFHPLYFLVCSAVLKLGLSHALTVHLLLTLASIWGLAAAWFVSRLVRHLTGQDFLALIGFILYALNPYIILQDLNGLETSLYGLFLTASFLAYLRLRSERAGTWPWLGLGLLIGLTILSRTEGIFLPIIIMIDAAWLLIKGRLNQRLFTGLLTAAAACLLTVFPWIAWNLHTFGTVQQDSGKIFPFRAQLLFESHFGRPPGFRDYFHEAISSLGWNIYILGNMVLGVPYTAAKKILVFFLLFPPFFLGWISGRFPWKGRANLAGLRPFSFGVLYMIFMFGYYTFYHRVAHWRYFYVMLVISIPVILGLAAGFQLEAFWRDSRRFAVLAVLGLYLLASNYVLILADSTFGLQRKMFQAARWMDANLPVNARVGAFNAGIYGYWSGRQVINLDGVVNREMLEVMKTKQMAAYVAKKKIDYYCDDENATEEYFRLFSQGEKRDNWKLLQSYGIRSEGQINIYQLPPAAPPQ
jgi:4-amino-4-deoxy-L-arabinose transferase-like glycosyltransferase